MSLRDRARAAGRAVWDQRAEAGLVASAVEHCDAIVDAALEVPQVTAEEVRAARDAVNSLEVGYLPVGVGETFLSILGIEVERRPTVGTTTKCLHPACRFRVMFTDAGWCHIDTHGYPINHQARP